MNSTTIAQNPPLMKFETLVTTLGAPVRCAILGALSDGTPRMVNEIAKMIGQKPGLVSKHLAVLRGAFPTSATVARAMGWCPSIWPCCAGRAWWW